MINTYRLWDERINSAADVDTRYTVLSSPHVDKKARQQFEQRTHKRLIVLVEPTARTVDALNRLTMPPTWSSRSRSGRSPLPGSDCVKE